MAAITLFDPTRLPARDELGDVMHPDAPDYDEDEDASIKLEALGFECRSVTMNLVYEERYFGQDDADKSWWVPSPPEGEGWLLVGIWDNDDGPLACYTRPLPSTLATWERNDEITLDILLLVGGHTISADDVALWTDPQCRDAEAWAAAAHFHASDNDDVKVPPVPACVRPHLVD
ncbi:hypothetical protein [Methylibium sp.]|uniref:hypothetical protein n=1 Tax=Methylibium sp. TaxID=2067992 RepID=UPI003D118B16